MTGSSVSIARALTRWCASACVPAQIRSRITRRFRHARARARCVTRRPPFNGGAIDAFVNQPDELIDIAITGSSAHAARRARRRRPRTFRGGAACRAPRLCGPSRRPPRDARPTPRRPLPPVCAHADGRSGRSARHPKACCTVRPIRVRPRGSVQRAPGPLEPTRHNLSARIPNIKRALWGRINPCWTRWAAVKRACAERRVRSTIALPVEVAASGILGVQ